jgi:hypothetical protein
MKNKLVFSLLAICCGVFAHIGTGFATTSVLNSTVDTLTVTGYSNTGSGGALQTKTLDWYSGTGYGIKSTSNEVDPEHAVDNNGYQEALLLNFGASTQLNSVMVGWTSAGRDSDITVLAWNPSAYMAGSSVPAPVLAGATYSSLIGLGWSLVGNYANLVAGQSMAVNGGSNPVSSSYWLVMAYNSLIGVAASASSDTTAKSYVADTSPDYGKFYQVTYSAGTRTPPGKVPEPSTGLLLVLALFGLIGMRIRKQSV